MSIYPSIYLSFAQNIVKQQTCYKPQNPEKNKIGEK